MKAAGKGGKKRYQPDGGHPPGGGSREVRSARARERRRAARETGRRALRRCVGGPPEREEGRACAALGRGRRARAGRARAPARAAPPGARSRAPRPSLTPGTAATALRPALFPRAPLDLRSSHAPALASPARGSLALRARPPPRCLGAVVLAPRTAHSPRRRTSGPFPALSPARRAGSAASDPSQSSREGASRPCAPDRQSPAPRARAPRRPPRAASLALGATRGEREQSIPAPRPRPLARPRGPPRRDSAGTPASPAHTRSPLSLAFSARARAPFSDRAATL